MKPAPLLFCAYMGSLTAAITLWWAAGGFVAPLLTFWLGGAAAALGLSFLKVFRSPDEDRTQAIDLDAWSDDQIREASGGAADERGLRDSA